MALPDRWQLLQVTLTEDGGQNGKVLLFGDLAYETIMKIFNYSEYYDREKYLEWNLLLAPHHCSKYVMHVREDGKDILKTDILDAFERHARAGSVVVASSKPIPRADVGGANPPHKMAAERYQDYSDRFICTMEWPSVEEPSPVVLGVDANGAQVIENEVVELSARSASIAKAAGRRRGRLSVVATAATAAGRYAAGVVLISETAAMTGPERVQAAIKADRGPDAPPTTAVGFGRE